MNVWIIGIIVLLSLATLCVHLYGRSVGKRPTDWFHYIEEANLRERLRD